MMEMDPGFKIRELFHVFVLRQLAGRLSARPYAVKGGICLRFFHRSPRLSEDMDVDVDRAVPVNTLQKNVDAILGSDVLAASLHALGIQTIHFTRPKQTETTQRWKTDLIRTGGERLSTKLEFSRRGLSLDITKGSPSPDVLREAFLAPFAVAYYAAPMMVHQKILALASPSRTAARDLFDLHHLLFTLQTPLEAMRETVGATLLEEATEKIGRFEFQDFQDQVLPYLPEDLRNLYGSASAFLALREAVETRLMGLLT